VPVRLVGLLVIATMAMGVAETAPVVGVLLSTALLIGPAARATYWVARPGLGINVAAALGVVETWTGIVLAYDSYYWTWPTSGKGWPVSFFITVLTLGNYLLAGLARPAARRRQIALASVMEAAA
jgi:zinc/manganese transport system permease protein